MTLILHSPTCIGGTKGPCNCGAVAAAQESYYHARRRHMQNVIREARLASDGMLKTAKDLERQSEKLVAFAEKTAQELAEWEKLHAAPCPTEPMLLQVDNPARKE